MRGDIGTEERRKEPVGPGALADQEPVAGLVRAVPDEPEHDVSESARQPELPSLGRVHHGVPAEQDPRAVRHFDPFLRGEPRDGIPVQKQDHTILSEQIPPECPLIRARVVTTVQRFHFRGVPRRETFRDSDPDVRRHGSDLQQFQIRDVCAVDRRTVGP